MDIAFHDDKRTKQVEKELYPRDHKKWREVADVFNKTAFAIAVLSFCPGGIKIFGQHYTSEEKLSVKRKKEFLKVRRNLKKGLESETNSI